MWLRNIWMLPYRIEHKYFHVFIGSQKKLKILYTKSNKSKQILITGITNTTFPKERQYLKTELERNIVILYYWHFTLFQTLHSVNPQN